jgi:hypothetical protein
MAVIDGDSRAVIEVEKDVKDEGPLEALCSSGKKAELLVYEHSPAWTHA